LAASGWLVLPILLAVAVGVGLLDTLRTTAAQAYAYQLVRTAHAARGMALVNLGAQLLGTAGGLVAGYTLAEHGAAATFVVVALALAFGAFGLALVGGGAAGGAGGPDGTSGRPRAAARRERPSFAAARALLVRNRPVAV